jgi:hypothetical protein
MAFAVAFKSREDHRKQIALDEARKAGLAPAEVDEDGKEINPHIPQYMSSAPWYLNAERPVSFMDFFFFVSYFLILSCSVMSSLHMLMKDFLCFWFRA